MNRKQRKLIFIRYKNNAKKLFPSPKWQLKRSVDWLCEWINTRPSILEASYILVSYESQMEEGIG